MTNHREPAARRVGRVIVASLAAGIGLAFAVAPAFADQPWEHDGWRHHERWEHHHRWHYRDDDGWRGYVYGYAAPPPVYYGPPSVSFGVNIPLSH